MTFNAAPPAPVTEPVITNGGWFPDIDPGAFRRVARVDGSATPDRIRHLLISAIGSVNDELDAWRAEQVWAGITTLAGISGPLIDGQPRAVHLYLRAVYCLANAELLDRYRDFGATPKADKRAETTEPGIDDLRRDARWAISDLLGIRRTTAELI